ALDTPCSGTINCRFPLKSSSKLRLSRPIKAPRQRSIPNLNSNVIECYVAGAQRVSEESNLDSPSKS
ncbi:hypothetical protein H0H92_003279, partial [Tricholoma furcatifolium]